MVKESNAPEDLPNLENSKRKIYQSGINFILKNFMKDSALSTSLKVNFENQDVEPLLRIEMSLSQLPKTGLMKQTLYFYNWNPTHHPANVGEYWEKNSSQKMEKHLAKTKSLRILN